MNHVVNEMTPLNVVFHRRVRIASVSKYNVDNLESKTPS
jgi:hypothetical protein